MYTIKSPDQQEPVTSAKVSESNIDNYMKYKYLSVFLHVHREGETVLLMRLVVNDLSDFRRIDCGI